MSCLGCGAEKTIRAHLIPQAFIREVRGVGKKHALGVSDLSRFEPSQNGRFDDSILCAQCDNRLGADEKYAFETLAEFREIAKDIVKDVFELAQIGGDRLFRFAMGIVWKYSVTKPHYGQVQLGPYGEQLRLALFEDKPPPSYIDAFVMKIHTGKSSSNFYNTPTVDKFDGVNFARFTVGGFVFMLKLDKRDEKHLPADAWLRGRTVAAVPAIPMNEITEGLVQLDTVGHPKLLSIFGMTK